MSTEGGKSRLEIALKYYAGRPVIERIGASAAQVCACTVAAMPFPKSRTVWVWPSLRPPKGVMTDRKARASGVVAKCCTTSLKVCLKEK